MLAVAAAAAAAVWCWLFAPATSDLAAAVFRSDLFRAHGLLLYDAQWYDGHALPAYSVLSPALGGLLGSRLLGALATVVAVALFDRIGRRVYGERAWLGSLFFALTASINLAVGRIAFALGMALALGAVYAAQRARWPVAAVLAALSALASPLAGLFLALAGAAWALAERRRPAVLLAVCALVPALAVQYAFREGGTFSYSAFSVVQALVFCACALVVLPREQRTVRIAVLMLLALVVLAKVVPSPLGGNVNRLGTVLGGPVLAMALWRRRTLALVAIAPLIVWWPVHDLMRDAPDAGGRSTQAAFYAPLISYLRAHVHGPARIEIPPTRDHWESVFVGTRYELARGWERQLDEKYNALFYGTVIDARNYRAWLDRNAVSYVALASAPSDFASRSEADFIRSARPPYLQPVWANADWRLFKVRRSEPLLSGPGTLVAAGPETFRILARRAGAFLLRVHFSPYFAVSGGCVAVGRRDFTRVQLRSAGNADVRVRFDPVRALSRSPRCS